MGLFSGKKKTYVSSSVWNLAGDIKDRPNYLKTTVLGSVLLDTAKSTGEAITSSYLNGPGIQIRRYANWAKGNSNYNNEVGFIGGGLSFGSEVDTEVLASNIPHSSSEYITIREYDIGIADSDWWAEQFMVNNYPTLLFTDWASEYNSADSSITITFTDGSTTVFFPTGINFSSRYIVALYQTVSGGIIGPVDSGNVVTVDSESQFPAVPSGYELYSVVETTTSKTTIYHKYSLIDGASSVRSLYIQEIRNTHTTPIYSYHFDTQNVANDAVSPYRYYMYGQNTGIPELDTFFSSSSPVEAYLPYIPIRINNSFIRDFDPSLYSKTQKAFKKAIPGSRLGDVVDQIETNEQIGDLDFVYTVFGASLNTPDNAAKEYIFEFFSNALSDSSDSSVRFQEWEAKWNEADESMTNYLAWFMAGQGTGSAAPTVIPYPELPVVSVDLKSTTGFMNFHMAIQMNGLLANSGIGILPGRKVGDFWVETLPSKTYRKQYAAGGTNGSPVSPSTYTIEVTRTTILHQVSANSWESIEVLGLVHKNYVYDGKWVVINANEALSDSEESGFIIPIHEDTFRKMSMVVSTQVSTTCCYLMFNCYKEVKQKWYQTGFFKVLAIAVTVAVSVVFAPAGAGTAGVLGSSATIGAAAGFTGTAAIVAGTIANALAAIVITKALTVAFGDKLGPILGAVTVTALTTYGGIGGNFSNFDAGSLMAELGRVDNLIALTDGLVKSVSAFINDKTMKIIEETQRVMEENKQDMLEVVKQYEQMFGTDGRGIIDPLLYTNAGYIGIGESRGAYIERTLMCGGDIAEMTQSLISNFTKTTLSLELPS